MSDKTIRCVEGQRLVYYRSEASVEFWEAHWREHLTPKFYSQAKQGNLDWFEQPFSRYLPKQGCILEAGCGLGQYVLALQARGYNVEGVDWGDETVEAVTKLHPDLSIRLGNVTGLAVPDGHYAAYISLGVVEHRFEGPEPFLHEAHRVLAPDGLAFISVPHFHRLRQLKAGLGLYRGRPDGLRFYQYAFTEAEFRKILNVSGFDILDQMLYGSFKGLKDELPPLRWAAGWRGIGWRLPRIFESWQWVEQNFGHMILFVCRKAR